MLASIICPVVRYEGIGNLLNWLPFVSIFVNMHFVDSQLLAFYNIHTNHITTWF